MKRYYLGVDWGDEAGQDVVRMKVEQTVEGRGGLWTFCWTMGLWCTRSIRRR
ncbi:MAG: hypothetical protein ACE5OR_15050 [bacterium]